MLAKLDVCDATPLLSAAVAQGATVWWRPRGFSMSPAIGHEDRVLVSGCHGAARLGDIVVCRTASGVVVHRVIRTGCGDDRRELVVAGDNAPERTDRVRTNQLLGRVVAIERDGRVQRIDTSIGRARGAVKALRRRWLSRGG